MVRLDRGLVQHYVGLAPSKFPVRARNPERDTVMGTNRINFNTVGSPPNVSDLERGRRSGTYQDLCDLVKLNHALGVIHLAGGAVVEPLDLPGTDTASRKHLRLAALYRPADHGANGQPLQSRGCDRHGGDRAGRDRESMIGEPSVLTSFNAIRRGASMKSCSTASCALPNTAR